MMSHVPSLSSLTAVELSTFVQREIEPDESYIQRCNAVVDRFCQFMQNSFPEKLKPSEIRKVGKQDKIHKHWFCCNNKFLFLEFLLFQ